MERPNDKDDKRRGDAERRFCEIGVVDPFDTFQLASLHPFSYSIACLYTQLARGLPRLSLSLPVCHSSKQYSFHSSSFLCEVNVLSSKNRISNKC